jgi:hypothetical protein
VTRTKRPAESGVITSKSQLDGLAPTNAWSPRTENQSEASVDSLGVINIPLITLRSSYYKKTSGSMVHLEIYVSPAKNTISPNFITALLDAQPMLRRRQACAYEKSPITTAVSCFVNFDDFRLNLTCHPFSKVETVVSLRNVDLTLSNCTDNLVSVTAAFQDTIIRLRHEYASEECFLVKCPYVVLQFSAGKTRAGQYFS